METPRNEPSSNVSFGSTSSTSSSSESQVPVALPMAPETDMSFTMVDVFQELEQLKHQVSSTYIPPTRQKSKYAKNKRNRSMSNKKSDDSLSNNVSTVNPWSRFNKEVAFVRHSWKMRELKDEEIHELACGEIGKRIAYHKEKCQNNEKRSHVHFKNKLRELKNKIDRSKAIVLIYVLQSCKEEEIEILERKLFPFSARTLLEMD